MIAVENVSQSYDKTEVLHDINLRIEKGQICGLVGPNGSGKTTLLKCMNGTYKPRKGQVAYGGKAIYDMPEVKQKVAYGSDAMGFAGGCSLKHIVRDMEILYDNFSMERFLQLAERMSLDLKKRPEALSKGQYTRFVLALMFAQNAEYLLLDEPETGLDQDGKVVFRELLTKEAEEREIGVLLCSHDLESVERLCDRVAFLKEGTIMLDAPVDELFERVQKWGAVAADEAVVKTVQKQDGISVAIDHWMGKNVTLYTMGDGRLNESRLASMGLQEITKDRVSLEEVYDLVMHRSNLQKEANL